MSPDSVSGEAFLGPISSVVWQSRSDSVLYPHQRYKRYRGRSGRALGVRKNVRSDQCIQEEV